MSVHGFSVREDVAEVEFVYTSINMNPDRIYRVHFFM